MNWSSLSGSVEGELMDNDARHREHGSSGRPRLEIFPKMNHSKVYEAIERVRLVLIRTKSNDVGQDDIREFRQSFDELADGLPGFQVFNTELRYFRGLMKKFTLFDRPPISAANWEELIAEAESLLRRIDSGNML